jgi:hypothetical protein
MEFKLSEEDVNELFNLFSMLRSKHGDTFTKRFPNLMNRFESILNKIDAQEG